MKRLLKTALVALSLLGAIPSFPQAAEDPTSERWVEFRNGQISLDFDQIPVYVALDKIRTKTGIDIILPPAAGHELLNLQLSGLSPEPAVRSLLDYIGFRSFVLMYDGEGHPNRAVVLGTATGNAASLAAHPTAGPNGLEAAAEEPDRLFKDLEGWSERNPEERSRIEERLKAMPPSEKREQLLNEYGRQALGLTK